MYKNVCVIPARKGSKRLKNKNFLRFEKKSLIEHTIIAALRSKIFDRIILSSDDKKIIQIAKKYSVTPFLRKKYSDNFSSVSDATIFTLKNVEDLKKYKNVFQLMPTCPFRTEKDIVNSFKNFRRKKLLSQISCFKISWIHFNWAMEKKKAEYNFFFNKYKRKKNFDIFYPTGAVWISDIDHLIKTKNFYNDKTNFFEINWISAIDIDTKMDFLNAIKLNNLNKIIK